MKKKVISISTPFQFASFNNCFWDVDASKLDIIKDKNFIIARVLEYGIMEQIKELRTIYSDDEIRYVVKNSRNISKRVATFWSTILDIPTEEVYACSQQNLFPLKRSK